MHWQRRLKSRIKIREPLKKHTTLRIGGPADLFIRPRDSADLKVLLPALKRDKIPLLVMGAGSNLLAADKGLKAAILKLDSSFFKEISCRDTCLELGSAVMLGEAVREAARRGLGGIEFLAGIPGTVGGALAMNAGAWGRNIGELIEKARVMDYKGNISWLKKERIKFGYRKSSLAKYIILGARLKLARKNKEVTREEIKKYLSLRRKTQGVCLPNAGCIFKNPPEESAGRLIDLCGLKGKRIGGACVSRRHANFILNCGRAKAADVLKLMHLIKRRVKAKFNIDLQPEIKVWQ